MYIYRWCLPYKGTSSRSVHPECTHRTRKFICENITMKTCEKVKIVL